MDYSQELADYVDYLCNLPIVSNNGDHLEYIRTLSKKLIEEHKFLEDLCDIIGGDNAYSDYSKEELIEMLQTINTSANEWDDYQEELDVYDYSDYHTRWYQNERIGQL